MKAKIFSAAEFRHFEGRVSEELSAIDIALQRIAAGKYGMCIQCGGSISVQFD